MKFDEYIIKKREIEYEVMEILEYDRSEDAVYLVNLNDRKENKKYDSKVYKQWQNVIWNMRFEKYRLLKDVPEEIADEYFWWEIKKYVLKDGEYQIVMECHMSIGRELWLYFFYESDVATVFYEKERKLEAELETPYTAGDIIEIKANAFYDKSIGIYGGIYGDEHIVILNKEGEVVIKCCPYFGRTSQTECNDEWFTGISKSLKEDPAVIADLVEKYGITAWD